MKRGYGELLKKTRESRNLKLPDIHKELKIDPTYLKALEDENAELFEKPVYMKLFLRTYAKYLKIQENEVLELYENDPEVAAREKEAKKLSEKRDVHKEIVREETPQEKEHAGEKLQLTINTKKNMVIVGSVLAAVIILILGALLIFSGGKSDAAANGQDVYSVPVQESLKVIAKGKDDVWMKVRHDGKEEDFFLKKGEERKWKDMQRIVFLIGNAAGVEFIVNGDSIGTIGEEGEVINGLVFQVGKNWYIDKGQGFKRARKPTPTEVPPTPTEVVEEPDLETIPAGVTPVETSEM